MISFDFGVCSCRDMALLKKGAVQKKHTFAPAKCLFLSFEFWLTYIQNKELFNKSYNVCCTLLQIKTEICIITHYAPELIKFDSINIYVTIIIVIKIEFLFFYIILVYDGEFE